MMKFSSPILDTQGKRIACYYPTYFIADIAANRDNDLGRAKDLIYFVAEADEDAVKFQYFQAKTIVSEFGFKNICGQQSHQADWKKPVFEVYKRELSLVKIPIDSISPYFKE